MSAEEDLEHLATIVEEGLAELRKAPDLDALKALEAGIFGKKSLLAQLSQQLGALPPEQRKAIGQVVHQARSDLLEATDARKRELTNAAGDLALAADTLDLTEALPARGRGHLNLVTQTRDRLEDVFVSMGFTVEEGPEVETDWYNFTALNLAPAHPARSMHDSLYLDWGAPESTLLRTHTSPVQIRLMQAERPPLYAVMPGRVYRKDTPDARHNPSFSQIEGLVVDHQITFADLAGTIEAFTAAYFGPDIHSRLRPYYFPFTEPSAEYEITCTVCKGDGCRTCSNTGWVELGGCGMVHPNVFRNVNLDPEEWSGFAFGFGIDRLAQMRYSISDMRGVLENDVRFIHQF